MEVIKFLIICTLIVNTLVCKSSDPTYHDYLVTNKNDTIFGKITWKNNVNVFLENEDGKQKFRADKVNFFQRGAYRFVSIHTKFPEYLREVTNGEFSYYVESYIKPKTTIDYVPRCYFKHNEEVIPFILPKVKYNFYSISINNVTGIALILNEFEYEFSNFKMTMSKIINAQNSLSASIENGNYTFDDVVEIAQLYNSGKEIDNSNNLPKNYSKGHLINLEHDTIFGLIKNEKPIKISDNIKFIDRDGIKKEYEPNEIIQFKINNRVYYGHTFENRKKRDSKIFLEKMQSGSISLYVEYVSPNGPNLIDAIKKEVPKPTYYDYNLNINGKYYIQKGDGDLVPVDTDYKFLDLFKDKNDIYDRIVFNEYKRFEIESMVLLYNNALQQ